ncbi:MAG: hypothetical protein C4532_11350 [Candidatus Abyssobacteria bacterium SURF_17]|uniref:GatB/YqeY domain-containing protein n=1 Tax=Candidatus Abyssobacteria bacterium SURF_17 TaxID=2093361 RepID=A0A419EWY2_9BACT|nr:MAG: hypothetical protein C4532_11350 [Candidatus Abyssubacteria bacterium SURF_17]
MTQPKQEDEGCVSDDHAGGTRVGGLAMTIKEKVEAGIKEALKAKDQRRLSALRMIKAELLLKEKETGKTLEDSLADQALQKMLKKYQKARDEYRSLNRPGEAEQYEDDMKIIEGFMSAPMMDESQIRTELERVVAELNASGPKDFGKVMKAFMSAHSNADGKVVSAALKGMLEK